MEPAASPSTRRLAREAGIDLDELAARLGRTELTKADIAAASGSVAAAAPAGTPAADPWDVDHTLYGPVTAEPLSRFARVAAARLSTAQSRIPAVTHHDRAEMSEVEVARTRLKSEAEARGVRLTALAFHVAALARTLRDFPRFNASLSPDGETLLRKEYVHIGIAVDAPHGLVVPVVRNADRKGLFSLAGEIADLAARAQARGLRLDEMGGASMSMSNLGAIGGTGFSPIVNPPELAILGISRAEMLPVWTGTDFVPRLLAPLHLSYDHRVINGADAARFLVRYAALVRDPCALMI